MGKIKIVNVVDEFYPNAGYENNILSKFMVKKGYDYQILTTHFLKEGNYMDAFDLSNIEDKDKRFEEDYGVKIHRLHIKKRISGRAIWNFKEFINKVNYISPDILFFCGNDTLIFMRFVLKSKRKIIHNKLPYKIICDSHMLEMASKNKMNKVFYFFYRRLITPIIKKSNMTVIRVQDDPFVIKRLGVPRNQTPFISFGTDTSLFFPDENYKNVERNKINISSNDFVVLYAGKINESKGGMLLADLINAKYNTDKNIIFIVVANARTEYEKKVIDNIKQSTNRVIIHPAVSYNELAYYYKISDLAVFPKQCSLSFYDIQACGLPVLLSDNNVNKDRLQYGNGFLFDGTSEDFIHTLKQIVELQNYQLYKQNALKFILEKYDYSNISNIYDEIFNKLI